MNDVELAQWLRNTFERTYEYSMKKDSKVISSDSVNVAWLLTARELQKKIDDDIASRLGIIYMKYKMAWTDGKVLSPEEMKLLLKSHFFSSIPRTEASVDTEDESSEVSVMPASVGGKNSASVLLKKVKKDD